MHNLHQLVVVPVVHRNADNYGALHLERLLDRGRGLGALRIVAQAPCRQASRLFEEVIGSREGVRFLTLTCTSATDDCDGD